MVNSSESPKSKDQSGSGKNKGKPLDRKSPARSIPINPRSAHKITAGR